jgi:hypothetical protein
MQFIWFWTFWHWSKESFRSGSLLRNPLHGIGSHWDEWFHHEASQDDRHAVEQVGASESSQRAFIAWLLRHWADEEEFRSNGVARHFVLGQLAQFAPFNQWTSFEKYRDTYGIGGIPAIVLAETSDGEPQDVRPAEALLLPADSTAPAVVADGFEADPVELDTIRRSATSLVAGKGLLIFMGTWAARGQRPFPRWLRLGLRFGWAAVAGLILILLFGPDPGERLFLLIGLLMALWAALVLTAAGVLGTVSWRAWRVGRELSSALEQSQVRLRMNGGLTLKGGSAALPFCLNTVFALAHFQPETVNRSWLWTRLFRRIRSDGASWAATGVLTADGHIKPVVLESKLRACLKHGGIRDVLAPRQRDGKQETVERLLGSLATTPSRPSASVQVLPTTQLGFAAERPQLRTHLCRHAGHSLVALAGLADRWQCGTALFAIVVSVVMLLALPDLRSILLPRESPAAVPPASPSPYELWVSLDTKYPQYFSVVLESPYWSNRREEVKLHGGASPSVRAEIHFHRLTGVGDGSENDGDVWIQRRQRFLIREFNPGERIGRYSLPYLSHLGHE